MPSVFNGAFLILLVIVNDEELIGLRVDLAVLRSIGHGRRILEVLVGVGDALGAAVDFLGIAEQQEDFILRGLAVLDALHVAAVNGLAADDFPGPQEPRQQQDHEDRGDPAPPLAGRGPAPFRLKFPTHL